MIGGALGYLRDWGLMMLVNLSRFQLVARHHTSVRLLARMTTCKGDCEVVGVVDTRDLPLTDFESVNGNLHLQLPLCNTLY